MRCPLDVSDLAERLDEVEAADVVAFREDGETVVRREREELRFAPGPDGGWRISGDAAVLDEGRYPNGLERVWRALANPNAGEVLVSARAGVEFLDFGGRHHAGGGSHGSLVAGDSTVPVVAAGLDPPAVGGRPSLTDLAPLALRYLGVPPPASMDAAALEPAGV